MSEIEKYIQLVFKKYGWSEARRFLTFLCDYAKELYEEFVEENEDDK